MKKIKKTDLEWEAILSPQQFFVCRKKGTEPPFTGNLLDNKRKGQYCCICCDLPLFSSETKFDSGTGWPSFYSPIKNGNVTIEDDFSLNDLRSEVKCSRCDSHLGHVFEDGPPPTGLRYCMNSVALKFEEI